MECGICRRRSCAVSCPSCVSSHICDLRNALSRSRRELASAASLASQPHASQAAQARSRRLHSELQATVASFRSQASHARSRLESEREALSRRQRSLAARREAVFAARCALELRQERSVGSGGMSGALLHGLSMQLEDYVDRVAQERRKLVMQLLELFPLEAETIANLALPSDTRQLRAMNEDARSAALAIVVRVLLIASSYLALTLPFRMEFLGSKASIGRWGPNEPQTMLTGTGCALESGMAMLRKNVEALCFYQGIPADLVREWSLLHSLWQLFHSPSLGNSVHQSLLEADSRVGRVKAGQTLRRPPPTMAQEGDVEAEDPMEEKAKREAAKRNAREQHLVRAAEGSADAARMSASASSFQDVSGSMDFVAYEEGELAFAAENWDLIERPQPPKPSNNDDIQHWVSSGALDG